MQDITLWTIDSRLLFLVLRKLNPNTTLAYYYNEDLRQYLHAQNDPNTYKVDWNKEGSDSILITQDGRYLNIRILNEDFESFSEIVENYSLSITDEFSLYLNSVEPLAKKIPIASEEPVIAKGQSLLDKQSQRLSDKSSQRTFFTHTRNLSLSSFEQPLRSSSRSLESDPVLKSQHDPQPPPVLLTSNSISEQNEFDTSYTGNYPLFLLHALLNRKTMKAFSKVKDRKPTKDQIRFLKTAKSLLVDIKSERIKLEKESDIIHSRLQKSSSQPMLASIFPPPKASRKVSLPTLQKSPRHVQRPSCFIADVPVDRSIGSKLLDNLEKRLNENALQHLIQQSFSDFEFPMKAFNSFGDKKNLATKLFQNPTGLQQLITDKNKILADNLMSLLDACFEYDEYNPPKNSEAFNAWFQLFIHYLRTIKCIPDFFCVSIASHKFLRTMSAENINELRQTLIDLKLDTSFVTLISDRFVKERDERLACYFLMQSFQKLLLLIKEIKGESHYFYILLSLKSKRTDLALLTDPRFREFIRNTRSVVCQYQYAQLLERFHSYFDYDNLPLDGSIGSDRRQTQDLSTKTNKARAYSESLLTQQFLSDRQINTAFLTEDVSNKKNENYKLWLECYQANLRLIISRFLPHLPKHFDNLWDIYDRYYKQTMGRLASAGQLEKYNPENQDLPFFPQEMVQYLKQFPEDVTTFNSNLEKMSTYYSEIKKLSDGTVKINRKEQSGFIPATRLAKNILRLLPPGATEFNSFNLAMLISALIIEHCQEELARSGTIVGICSETTLTDILCNEYPMLWMTKEISQDLLLEFSKTIKALKSTADEAIKTDFFNEIPVIQTIEAFCNVNFQSFLISQRGRSASFNEVIF